jgi:F420-dependent oxidoreductase-like protein
MEWLTGTRRMRKRNDRDGKTETGSAAGILVRTPARESDWHRTGSGTPGFRLDLHGRVLGLGRVYAAGVDRRTHLENPPRYRHRAALRSDAYGYRHGRALGVSGPQVVEGWYGQPFAKPLARTREYVDIIRQVLRRQRPVTHPGPHYPLPYKGEGAWGLGKPLKVMTHPLRADLPIWLGAEGPKNVALAAEICDGWIPLYYSPYRIEVYADQIEHAKPGFEIAPLTHVSISNDVETALLPVKAMLGFYVGGMGAKQHNFHKDLMVRMGFEAEANRIQQLFAEGKRDEAIAAVPDQFADEISLVGPVERIRDRLQAWEAGPATMLLLGAHDISAMRSIAEVVLGR